MSALALRSSDRRAVAFSARRLACALTLVAIVLSAASFSGRAAAQVLVPEAPKRVENKTYEPPWEYSPYRVHVWLVADGSRTLSPATIENVREELLDEIDLAFGPAWRTSASVAPTDVAAAALASLGDLTVFDFDRLGRGWWFSGIDGIPFGDFEKIYLVVLRDEGAEFDVSVREFEIPTYQTGLVRSERAGSLRELAPVARSLIAKSFTRLARVERAYDTEESVETDAGPKVKRTQRAAVRFRAAGLMSEGIEALVPPIGAPMTIAVRSNDRLGVPSPEGVAEMEFTYVQAERIEGSLVDGAIYSGLHSPLGGRSSRRIQRYVRWFPYAQGTTTLRIVSPATEASPSRPLGGYDIYSRDPEGEESTFLGETDWKGEFVVPAGERPLRVLYAKSGERLLARLPLAPGLYREATAIVPDDTFRLEAEGAVAAFQSRLTDLIARRQALAVRIRKKIEQNEVAEAKRLLEEEFKPMFDRTGLTFELEELRKRFSTEDAALARRIETMFDTTRDVLNKFLDATLDRQLEAQVKDAGGASPPAG